MSVFVPSCSIDCLRILLWHWMGPMKRVFDAGLDEFQTGAGHHRYTVSYSAPHWPASVEHIDLMRPRRTIGQDFSSFSEAIDVRCVDVGRP